MRKKLIAGNWKMNGSQSFNEDWAKGIKTELIQLGSSIEAEVMVCVPAPYLSQMRLLLKGTPVALGAQDVSAHSKGAYTGEISLGMLMDFGVQGVIIGHSERRAYHGESDAVVAQKVKSCASSSVTPIVCLGETQAQRTAGQTNQVIQSQLSAVMSALETDFHHLVVAYEPVWAIGTGLTATPEQAQEVHAFIRGLLSTKTKHSQTIKILYGGSMNAQNASSLLSLPDVDGGLIGGASLLSEDFVKIIKSVSV
jgi:triosephosphate isomerase